MMDSNIEALVRQLYVALIQNGKEFGGELDVTPAQSVLLGYLLASSKQEICLTEISAEAGISKASVSAMLKILREKGYLSMKAVSGDDRKKKIVLTERAYQLQDTIEKSLKERSEGICEGISKQELAIAEHVLQKMILNLKRKREKDKEEKIW